MSRARDLKRRLKSTLLHPRFLSNRAIRQALRKFAPAASGRMLDLGCGYKPYKELFAPYVTEHVGVDIPVTIHGLEALDVGGTALALPVSDVSFDTVLATEVMEHVPDPRLMLDEVRRVLRPGGTLILSVPLHEPLHELPYDFYRYTHIALERLLSEHGFQVRGVERRGGPLAVVAHLLCSFIYRRFGLRAFPADLRLRPLAGPPVVAFCVAVQLVAILLDPVLRDENDTLGFVVLAQKE
jgi:SAM-dependent methyltransferase